MQTITASGVTAVRDLFRGSGPVVSVYTDAGPGAQGEAELRRRAIVTELTQQGADARVLRVVTNHLAQVPQTRGVGALFVGGGVVLGSFLLRGAPPFESAAFGELPCVVPLLRWLQSQPARVVAVLDRAGADIWSCAQGKAQTRIWSVDGPDDEIERNAPGGPSQLRYQHRAEDSWAHNAGRVAAEVTRALTDLDARVLLLSGDVRALQYLEDQLPAWVRRDVRVRRLTGSRSADGSAQGRADQVAQAVSDAVEAESEQLLTRLRDGLNPNGHATEGVLPTLEALGSGRVATLLITDDPLSERNAWFGPAPTDIADQREPLLQQQNGMRRGRLADVAVRSAVLGSADVMVLAPGRKDAPAEGIGALCRFA